MNQGQETSLNQISYWERISSMGDEIIFPVFHYDRLWLRKRNCNKSIDCDSNIQQIQETFIDCWLSATIWFIIELLIISSWISKRDYNEMFHMNLSVCLFNYLVILSFHHFIGSYLSHISWKLRFYRMHNFKNTINQTTQINAVGESDTQSLFSMPLQVVY